MGPTLCLVLLTHLILMMAWDRIPNLQVEKLSPRQMKQLAQGHVAHREGAGLGGQPQAYTLSQGLEPVTTRHWALGAHVFLDLDKLKSSCL